MISTTNRVFDYFTTIGIDDKLIENQRSEEELPLTGLEIIQSSSGNFKDTQTEKYVDILGDKNLWLRCYYGKDKPAITDIGLYYFKYKNEALTIKEKHNLIPVPIVKNIEDRHPQINKQTIDGSDYWKGNFDLTQLIYVDNKPGYAFALSYKLQSKKNFNTQILRVKVITAKTSNNNKLKNGDLHVVVPIQHEIINFSFGIEEKNRVFSYMRDFEIQNKRFKPAVLDRYPLTDHMHTPFPDAVSQFCFPEGVRFKRDNLTQPECFNFVLTLQDGCRIYCTCLIFNEVPDQKLIELLGHIKIDDQNSLFVQKAICLISHYNYFDEYKQILKHLYRLSLSKNEIPIERFICNIVDDIRLPLEITDWGKLGIQYEIGAETVVFGTSHKYPPFSAKSLLTLFRLLDIDKIIFLFECILLEKKLFIISKYKSVITQVAEALISLIFPFQWNHVYIPILPDMFKTYMEAPLPFIIGLEQKLKNFDISSGIQSESIQAYLDSNDLINIEWMPALPEKFLKQLKKRLQSYSNLHLPIQDVKNFLDMQDLAFENPFAEDEIPPVNFNPFDIRDSFLEFVSSFMMKYKKFLIPPDKKKANKEMSEIFDTREFLNFHKSSKQGTFLQKFTETTMFSYFIETRTQISPFEPYYQFFDICLEKKRSKKDSILFVKEQLTKIIFVQQPNEQDLDKSQFYSYERFPKLKPDLFTKCQKLEEVIKAEFNLMEIEQQQEDISQFDEYRWAKYLYEQIYYIWFQIFILKLKQDFFSPYYTKLTDYAIFLLGQLRKKNHALTEIMYRFVIEACGYYGKDDKVIELVQQMKEQNIETSPITHGVFFQAVTQSKEYFAAQEEMRKKVFENQMTIVEENSKDNENQEQKVAKGLNNIKLNIGTQIQQQNFKSKFDHILFTIIETCPNCNRNLFPEEIISNWKRGNTDYRTKCPIPSCSHEFVSKFQVVTLEEKQGIDITNVSVYNNLRKQVEFLSPQIVRKELENIMKQKGQSSIMSSKFEEDHPIIYWNIILYFKLIRAPTFFLEFNQPEYYYNYHAMLCEKKIKDSIKNQEKGILSKMSEYFFQNKKEDDDKTSHSSFTHLSPPQDNASMGSVGARKDQKDSAIINFGTKSIKKIFTQLLIKLRKDGENKLHDLELKKQSQNLITEEQGKNLEKLEVPSETQ
ncbi:hypothetical protein ABPG72_004736 [Tetrahymena utriculariae]